MSAPDCVVVRLLLLPDRIEIPADQRVPGHTFLNIRLLAHYWLFDAQPREDPPYVFRIKVPTDRRRYDAVLDDIRERVACNLKGEFVSFDLETDRSHPLPWAIDYPWALCHTS